MMTNSKLALIGGRLPPLCCCIEILLTQTLNFYFLIWLFWWWFLYRQRILNWLVAGEFSWLVWQFCELSFQSVPFLVWFLDTVIRNVTLFGTRSLQSFVNHY